MRAHNADAVLRPRIAPPVERMLYTWQLIFSRLTGTVSSAFMIGIVSLYL